MPVGELASTPRMPSTFATAIPIGAIDREGHLHLRQDPARRLRAQRRRCRRRATPFSPMDGIDVSAAIEHHRRPSPRRHPYPESAQRHPGRPFPSSTTWRGSRNRSWTSSAPTTGSSPTSTSSPARTTRSSQTPRYLTDEEKKKAKANLGLLMRRPIPAAAQELDAERHDEPLPHVPGAGAAPARPDRHLHRHARPGVRPIDRTRLRGYLEIDEQKLTDRHRAASGGGEAAVRKRHHRGPRRELGGGVTLWTPCCGRTCRPAASSRERVTTLDSRDCESNRDPSPTTR